MIEHLKNIAVVGAGYWGKNLINNFKKIGALKYIYDQNESLTKAYPSELVTSFERIISDEEIEGVVIATPAETHFSLAKYLMENGKHVFVEKPVCLNLEDAKALANISLNTGRVLMVGHLLQYHDHFKKLLELKDNLSLGKLIKAKSQRKSFGKLRVNENVIWSFAPHDISMLNKVCSNNGFSNFKIIKNSYFNENIDAATFSYKKGDVHVEVEVDWSSPIKCQKLELFFEKGILVFEDSEPELNRKLYLLNNDYNERGLKEKNKLEKKYFEVSGKEPLLNECEHFLECIKKNSRPVTDINESIEVLEILLKTDE